MHRRRPPGRCWPPLADLALSALAAAVRTRRWCWASPGRCGSRCWFYALFCVLIVNRRGGLAVLALWLLATALGAVAGRSIPAGCRCRSMAPTTWSFPRHDRCLRAAVRHGPASQVGAGGRSLRCLLCGCGPRGHSPAGWLRATRHRLAYGIPGAIIVLGIAEADPAESAAHSRGAADDRCRVVARSTSSSSSCIGVALACAAWHSAGSSSAGRLGVRCARAGGSHRRGCHCRAASSTR